MSVLLFGSIISVTQLPSCPVSSSLDDYLFIFLQIWWWIRQLSAFLSLRPVSSCLPPRTVSFSHWRRGELIKKKRKSSSTPVSNSLQTSSNYHLLHSPRVLRLCLSRVCGAPITKPLPEVLRRVCPGLSQNVEVAVHVGDTRVFLQNVLLCLFTSSSDLRRRDKEHISGGPIQSENCLSNVCLPEHTSIQDGHHWSSVGMSN